MHSAANVPRSVISVARWPLFARKREKIPSLIGNVIRTNRPPGPLFVLTVDVMSQSLNESVSQSGQLVSRFDISVKKGIGPIVAH